MNRGLGKNFVLVAVVGLVIVTGLFLLSDPTPKRRALDPISRGLLECLPEELSEAHVAEVRAILERFRHRAKAGQIRPDDQQEVEKEMRGFVERGSISRSELNTLMAKVSYYTFRTDPNYQPPDGAGAHPLLQDEAADSTGS